MAGPAILAIDAGTTNTKAILVSGSGAILSRGASPVTTRHPSPGWAEQDADQIWSSVTHAASECLAGSSADTAAIGISNQRESILAWNRTTGEPLGPVVTWQCRRTAPACAALREAGHEEAVIAKTGLPLDPLFPATKIRWLLEKHCQGRAAREICVGTVDSWLIWKFTRGAVHATDASNASRTQLYNIGTGEWDTGLCDLFGVDPGLLPTVRDSSCAFGNTADSDGIPGGIPILSAVGDSHGALFAHGAFRPGDGKVTLGTGSSVMATVSEFTAPPGGITTTIAWQLSGKPTYAYEGNILVSASVLPWAAELLGLESVESLLELAQSVDNSLNVNLVPAHVGLGSPHWNPDARGLIDGLTFGARSAHIAHAAARSMALQICDVFDIIRDRSPDGIGALSVDGGPSRSAFLMQLLADHLEHPIMTRNSPEASALGAAFLAGLGAGFWRDLTAIAGLVGKERTFEPKTDISEQAAVRKGWRRAVARSMHLT